MKLDKYAVFCMFGMVLAVFSLVFGILGKGILAGSFGLATGGVCFAMLLLTTISHRAMPRIPTNRSWTDFGRVAVECVMRPSRCFGIVSAQSYT